MIDSNWKSVGLGGVLYGDAGGGQGAKQLQLGVNDAPAVEKWSGASGAPIMVAGELVGIIKQVPPSFNGDRLYGVPMADLLQHPTFRVMLEKTRLSPELLPSAKVWVLVVLAEAEDTRLGSWVDSALQKDRDTIRQQVDPSFELRSVKINIIEALQSPTHWLDLVRALCLAPIVIIDATDFEPAIMMALGIRSVVRRSVTITSTAHILSAEHTEFLPFNIKETKLLHHGNAYELDDERHPYRALASAIRRGWKEAQAQPRYLDLPAYDGVRCAYPASSDYDVGVVERILVLCPFSERYTRNWRALANELALRYPGRGPARMLDLTSPRLVGQALYEAIRWSRTCIVDWTNWRPNVFFEFGVRLASSGVGPIGLIESDSAETALADSLQQKDRLLQMWAPARYQIAPGNSPMLIEASRMMLAGAFDVHDVDLAGRFSPQEFDMVPRDGTYRLCRENFVWSQDGLTIEPQELLRHSVVDPFGPDLQQPGRQPILYAADNAGFSLALESSIRERWLAAWYYLSNRYSSEEWQTDRALRDKILILANNVLQFGLRRDETDPRLKSLRDELYVIIDKFDELA